MEKFLSLVKQYRQKSVLFAAITEPFQFVYRLIISLRYMTVRPLSCSGLYSIFLTAVSYVATQYYNFTIYFRIGIPAAVYIFAVYANVELVQPYKRRDLALNRKRSINNTFGGMRWINEDPVEMARTLKLYRNVNATDEWIFGRVGKLGKAALLWR